MQLSVTQAARSDEQYLEGMELTFVILSLLGLLNFPTAEKIGWLQI